MISDILGWTDRQLEDGHNYIQYLFPNREKSGFNPNAPLIDDSLVRAFHSADLGPQLKASLLRNFDRMLEFYGFQRLGDGTIQKSADFDSKRQWLSWGGQHNFLRITRILASLAELGLQEHALAFHGALTNLYTPGAEGYEPSCNNISSREFIPQNTRNFWANACYPN